MKRKDHDPEICAIKRCERPAVLTYSAGPKRGAGVCEKHWKKHCNEAESFNLKDPTFYR